MTPVFTGLVWAEARGSLCDVGREAAGRSALRFLPPPLPCTRLSPLPTRRLSVCSGLQQAFSEHAYVVAIVWGPGTPRNQLRVPVLWVGEGASMVFVAWLPVATVGCSHSLANCPVSRAPLTSPPSLIPVPTPPPGSFPDPQTETCRSSRTLPCLHSVPATLTSLGFVSPNKQAFTSRGYTRILLGP